MTDAQEVETELGHIKSIVDANIRELKAVLTRTQSASLCSSQSQESLTESIISIVVGKSRADKFRSDADDDDDDADDDEKDNDLMARDE
jgi:hypothetical protein